MPEIFYSLELTRSHQPCELFFLPKKTQKKGNGNTENTENTGNDFPGSAGLSACGVIA